MTFAQKENETFYRCWERYKEILNACPYHGFDKLHIISFFYNGLDPAMKQFIASMCNGQFVDKNADEAEEFFEKLADDTQQWDTAYTYDRTSKGKAPQTGGIYQIKTVEDDLSYKLAQLTREVETLKLKNVEPPKQTFVEKVCSLCDLTGHSTDECPTLPVLKEVLNADVNVLTSFKNNNAYGESNQPNWRNHPNLNYKNNSHSAPPPQHHQPFQGQSHQQQFHSQQSNPQFQSHQSFYPQQNFPPQQQYHQSQEHVNQSPNLNSNVPPHNSNIEDIMKNMFQQMLQAVTQVARGMDANASSPSPEKAGFPAHPQPNPKDNLNMRPLTSNTTHHEQAKAITTLRSGKVIGTRGEMHNSELIQPTVRESQIEEDIEVEVERILEEEPLIENEPKFEITFEEEKEKSKVAIPAPFPQRLKNPSKGSLNQEMLELFKQVKINLPLLDAIKQIPSYAKFLKDLCTVKRKLAVQKKAFMTEQVSSIIQSKMPPKYKDPGCPTVSCIIGKYRIDNALLDLGASINLLPYSVYQQLGLKDLKSTPITIQLADRSVKYPKGIVEDVLVQVDQFFYPVDFVVLETEPVVATKTQIPIILGRPFLATINAIISVRNGVMKMSFGNMTLDINIFSVPKEQNFKEEVDEIEMVNFIDAVEGEGVKSDPFQKEI